MASMIDHHRKEIERIGDDRQPCEEYLQGAHTTVAEPAGVGDGHPGWRGRIAERDLYRRQGNATAGGL